MSRQSTLYMLNSEVGRKFYPHGTLISVRVPELDREGYEAYPLHTVKRKYDGQIMTVRVKLYGMGKVKNLVNKQL